MESNSFLIVFLSNLKESIPLWLSVVGLIVGVTALFWTKGGLRERFKTPLTDALSQSNPDKWVQAINGLFLRVFERLFSAKGKLLEQIVWRGLILAPAFLLLFRAQDFFIRRELSASTELLNTSIAIAFGIVIGIAIERLLKPRKRGTLIVIGLFVGLLLALIGGFFSDLALRFGVGLISDFIRSV